MDKKLVEVIKALLGRDERTNLQWQAFDSESFRCQLGVGYLHVQRVVSHSGSEEEERTPGWTYSVQASDFQGRVVTDAEVGANDPSFAICEDLFNHARRKALGGDQILESMLQVLK